MNTLKECLRFSKSMIAARKKNNHNKKPDVQQEDRDEEIIELAGLIMAVRKEVKQKRK